MTAWRLPFSDPGAFEPVALADFYDRLHAADLRTFHDRCSDLYPTWGYEAVEKIMKGAESGVVNGNTLDPLTPMRKFAGNHRTWPSLVHLLGVPKATANASGAGHEAVRRAVFAHPGGLSLSPTITRDSVGELVRRRVHAVADEAERSARGGAVDLAAVFARPLSAGIISEIVGFPSTDERQVRLWSDAQTSLLDRAGQVQGVRGLSDLSRACRGLIALRAEAPADDLASHLLSKGLPARTAAAALMNIIVAGYATTYGTLLNALVRMFSEERREHWNLLQDKEILPALTGELVRLETGLVGWTRKATEALDLGGGSVVPAGGKIMLMLGAANRDPARFVEPHRIRLDRQARKEPKGLAFGTGPHVCVGREVARLEIGEALSVLRERFPGLRLAAERVRYDPDFLFRTPVSLPVLL